MRKTLHWFNNGTRQIMRTSIAECPPDFIPGTLPVKEESKEKNRQAHLGKTPVNKGISGVYTHTEAEKRLCGNSSRGMHYYNNGLVEIRTFICPTGFSPGRLKFSAPRNSGSKGLRWYNNGTEELFTQTCPMGFTEGRLPRTEETKKKISIKCKGYKHTPEARAKIKATSTGRLHSEESKRKIGRAHKLNWEHKTEEEREAFRLRCSEQAKRPEVQEKIWSTKKLNSTCSSSKPEEKYYDYLCKLYGKEDVVRQYKDERYPFHCDFYIKSLDLFIELNLSQFHHFRPFDKNNPKDLEELEQLKEKAKNHKTPENNQYLTIIKIWTVTDPLKIQVAKENNLNYKVYWRESDLEYYN